MFIETRKTAAGTEYWDNVAKKSLFVPAGKKPDFKVTKDPKSMIVETSTTAGPGDTRTTTSEGTQTDINLDDMNTEQLHAFAKDNDIEVPGNMKKEETIRNHIFDAINADDSE